MKNSEVSRFLDRLFADGVPVSQNSQTYSALVPKDVYRNVKWRQAILEAGYSDRDVAMQLRMLCGRDALFFLNVFGWILEARRSAGWQVRDRMAGSKTIPFITRGYQDRVIELAIPHLGMRDIRVPKSRETGVTWIFCGLACWEWCLHPDTHIGIASKDESSVGDFDDPDSLFSKLEFLIHRLPFWLRPRQITRNVNNISLVNEDNNSTMMGYAAIADLTRGGRKAWMLMDEFHFFKPGSDVAALESTQHVTRSRVLVSTFNRVRGQSGAFYDEVSREDDSAETIVIDWKDDVDKARGLYASDRIGDSDLFALRIIDKEFWKEFREPHNTYRNPMDKKVVYPFILDGKTRSMYYDFEWKRGSPEAIAAELDRDPAGATSQYCDRSVMQKADLKACEPYHQFDVSRDVEVVDRPFEINRRIKGLLGLWCDLDEDGRPPRDQYCLGADIGAGTGGSQSSYSHIAMFSKTSGIQVAEWRSNRMGVTDFADLCMFLGKLFWDAYLIPECNGPLGSIFTNRVMEMRYRYLFQRRTKWTRDKRTQHGTSEPGYRNPDRGMELLTNLVEGLRVGACVVKSKLAIREMGRYVLKLGELTHTSLRDEKDGAAQGKAHGDAAIGTAAAWYGCTDWPATKAGDVPDVVPEGCALHRRNEYLKKQRRAGQKSYWCPSFVGDS
jgi:hypothetical protein